MVLSYLYLREEPENGPDRLGRPPLAASREELLQTAKWRRALAVKARVVSLEITNDAARRSLLQHAVDLERQADELEAQVKVLNGKGK